MNLKSRIPGDTILEHVIRKSKQLNVDTVIVSTTIAEEDDIIADMALLSGAQISFGPADDRTARYCSAISDYDLDYFIHISPAAPFFDIDYTNRLIEAFRDNPGYDHYSIGEHTEFVPRIFSGPLTLKALENSDRDEEIFYNEKDVISNYSVYNWYDPELKNRYLFNGNIAYRIQADNHRRICEYLGHFPESYDEVVEALMGIGL